MTMTDSMALLQQTAAAKAASSSSGTGSASDSRDTTGKKTDFQNLLTKKSGDQTQASKKVQKETTSQESKKNSVGTASQESGKAADAGKEQENPLQQELAAALLAQVAALSPQQEAAAAETDSQGPSVVPQVVVSSVAAESVSQQLPLEKTAESQSQFQAGTLPEQTQGTAAEVITPVSGQGKTAEAQVQTNLTGGKSDVSAALVPENTGQEAGEEKNFQISLEKGPQLLFHDTESVPVKVGENATLDTTDAGFGEKLAGQIHQAVEQGTQKLTIQLTPKELGTVMVEMTQTEDGSLHVILHAATEKAVGTLTEHAAGLQNLLQNNNQSPVQVEVHRQEGNQNQGGFQQQYQDAQSGGNGQGSRQQQQQTQQEGQDFLQRLRLGLVPLDAEAV